MTSETPHSIYLDCANMTETVKLLQDACLDLPIDNEIRTILKNLSNIQDGIALLETACENVMGYNLDNQPNFN
jgi:hypothetical protein